MKGSPLNIAYIDSADATNSVIQLMHSADLFVNFFIYKPFLSFFQIVNILTRFKSMKNHHTYDQQNCQNLKFSSLFDFLCLQ